MAANVCAMSGRPHGIANFSELWEVNPQEDGGCDMVWRMEDKICPLWRHR